MCRATATFSDIISRATPLLYSAAVVPAHVAAGGGGGERRLSPLAASQPIRWHSNGAIDLLLVFSLQISSAEGLYVKGLGPTSQANVTGSLVVFFPTFF
jgi:hypothetical protein